MEIFNEAGYDLLDEEQEVKSLEELPRVHVMEDENGNIHTRNLSLHRAASEEDALNLVRMAASFTHRFVRLELVVAIIIASPSSFICQPINRKLRRVINSTLDLIPSLYSSHWNIHDYCIRCASVPIKYDVYLFWQRADHAKSLQHWGLTLGLGPSFWMQLFLGDTNRTISETPMNMASSRSHCIFTLHLEARKVPAQAYSTFSSSLEDSLSLSGFCDIYKH